MAIYIPFNQNPASRDIKTSAYTIPAGQFAYVHFLAYDTDCTIDSDVVIPALSVSDTQTVSADNTNVYSPTTGYDFEGQVTFFEQTLSTSDEYRLGVRFSATDYWMIGGAATSATNLNVVNSLGVGDGMAVDTTVGAPGWMPIYIPSGGSLSFDEVTGSISATLAVMGRLQTPIGVQHMFQVPTGIEVDGTKFEVTLFNEA